MTPFPRNLAHVMLATALALGLALPAIADVDSSNASSNPRANPIGKPQKPKGNRQATVEAQKSGNGLTGIALTADQQQQALGFARTQHPELADLLEKLKEGNPKEYSNALQELYRAGQKLHRIADHNPERYALELSLWKVGSRIRLLMAQMVMEGDGAQDENLKALLSERRSLKIELLQFDRGKTVDRLTNLDRQLEQLQRDPEGDIAKEMAKLKQTAGNQARVEKMKRKIPKAERKSAADQKPKERISDKPDAGTNPEAGKDE